MKTATALLLACFILAAAALPKAHHKPAKIVQKVENDLEDSDNDADLVADQASLEEDSAALEEDSDKEEPALENDDEDSDKEANVDADDSDNELEEEDEAQTKVASDISSLTKALEESDLSPKSRSEARANLDEIAADVRRIKTASPDRLHSLKQAINYRLQALHLMVDAPQLDEEEEEEDSKVHVVEGDITQLEEAVSASHLSHSAKDQARANLESIAKDAREFNTAVSDKAKNLYRKAIAERMQALHAMLEGDEEPGNKEPCKDAACRGGVQPSKVVTDVQHIQNALKKTHMSTKAKKAVQENLSHILKDAEEMQSAPSKQRDRLAQALKLRSHALREQLEEQ